MPPTHRVQTPKVAPGTSKVAAQLPNVTTDPSAAGTKYAGMLIPKSSIVPGVPGPNPINVIVQPNYTKQVRDVTGADKRVVGIRDGVVPPNATEAQSAQLLKGYEIDHLIPLIWGGANDHANLWAQPIAQARIKDTVEVHGRMFLRANPTPEALKQLQTAPNWIQAAVKVIDPYMASLSTPARVKLLADTAAEFAQAGNNNLAAAAYRELAQAHTPPAQRAPVAHPALMTELDNSAAWSAPKMAKEYGALAAKYEALSKKDDAKGID